MLHWQTYQKTSIKSETSGEFFGKLLPAQREKRGEHQLIINYFKDKHKLLEGKLKFKGPNYMFTVYTH
jgi:hypothetical protein